MPFRAEGVDPAAAEAAYNAFVNGLGQLGPVTLLTPAEFSAGLGPDYQTQLYGCRHDSQCLVLLGDNLDADRVFVGVVSGGRDTWSATVKMVNVKTGGSAVTVVTSPAQAERLAGAVQGLGKRLVTREQRSQFGTAGFNDVFETEFSYGLAAYHNGKYKEAHEHFDRALKEDPTQVQVNYYAGVAAYLAGDMEHAAAHLARSKGLGERTDVEVDYYMGLIAYKQEDYDAAKARFEAVRDKTDDERVYKSAEQHVALIDRVRVRKDMEDKNWKITASSGVQQDSNVIMNPETLQSQGRGTRAVFGGDGAVWAQPTAESRVGAALSFTQSFHFVGKSDEVQEYDMTYAMLDGFGHQYLEDDLFRLEGHVGGGLGRFRGAPSYFEANGSVGISRRIYDRAALGVMIPARYDLYDDEFPELTAVNYGALTFLGVDFVPGRLKGRAELAYDRNEPVKDDGDTFAYNGVRADLSAAVVALYQVQFNVNGGLHVKNWDRRNIRTGGSETTWSAGGGAQRVFAKRWFADLSYTFYLNDNSAIDTSRDFSRWILSLMVGLTF